MIVQEVIDTAKKSELGNVAVKNDTSAIVTFLNLGMMELYKRFPLSMKEEAITRIQGATLYALPSDFMYPVGAYNVPTTSNPDNELAELGINESGSENSIYFPNHKQVQVPSKIEGDHVFLMYVCNPEKYTADNLEVELDLPETLIEPLLHYIGYKGHAGVKADAQSENNAHWLRFDRSCQKARDLGVAHTINSLEMTSRLNDRGFV